MGRIWIYGVNLVLKLEQFLAHSRLSINGCWIREWMNEWNMHIFQMKYSTTQLYKSDNQVKLPMSQVLNLPVSNCITVSLWSSFCKVQDLPWWVSMCVCMSKHLQIHAISNFEPIFVWWVHARCELGRHLTHSPNWYTSTSQSMRSQGQGPCFSTSRY